MIGIVRTNALALLREHSSSVFATMNLDISAPKQNLKNLDKELLYLIHY